MSGASDGAIRDSETQLGFTLPEDYKGFVRVENGVDAACGEAWLMLYPVEELASINSAYDRSESHPGLVFIGSDGGGEGIAFDFRRNPPPVVLVNFVSSGWADGIVQAASFSQFMEQRRRGEPLRFVSDESDA